MDPRAYSTTISYNETREENQDALSWSTIQEAVVAVSRTPPSVSLTITLLRSLPFIICVSAFKPWFLVVRRIREGSLNFRTLSKSRNSMGHPRPTTTRDSSAVAIAQVEEILKKPTEKLLVKLDQAAAEQFREKHCCSEREAAIPITE